MSKDSSSKLLGMYLILFMLIFLFPSFNNQIIIIGTNASATTIEIVMMDVLPTFLIVGIILFAILILSYTIKMMR